jgi:hypothetical protein
MPDRRELLQWKQEVTERIDLLATYDTKLRTVQGRLGQIRYNVNSQITRMADERKEYRDLEKHLRETKRAFKQEFPDVPATLGGIEKATRHYQGIRASIERQLEHDAHLERTTDSLAAQQGLDHKASQVVPEHEHHARPDFESLYQRSSRPLRDRTPSQEQGHTRER